MTENHDLNTILMPFLLVKPSQHIFLVIFKSRFQKRTNSHQGARKSTPGVVSMLISNLLPFVAKRGIIYARQVVGITCYPMLYFLGLYEIPKMFQG